MTSFVLYFPSLMSFGIPFNIIMKSHHNNRCNTFGLVKLTQTHSNDISFCNRVVWDWIWSFIHLWCVCFSFLYDRTLIISSRLTGMLTMLICRTDELLKYFLSFSFNKFPIDLHWLFYILVDASIVVYINSLLKLKLESWKFSWQQVQKHTYCRSAFSRYEIVVVCISSDY